MEGAGPAHASSSIALNASEGLFPWESPAKALFG